MGHVALLLRDRHLELCGPGERRLRPGGEALEPRGVFERLELGHGRITLRTLDGRYLATRPDPGLNYGVYAEDDLTPAAAFEEILWPDGQVSLRSCHLTYVSAGPAGPVTVNRVAPGMFERFVLVEVPAPVVPAQRQSADRPTTAGTAAGR